MPPIKIPETAIVASDAYIPKCTNLAASFEVATFPQVRMMSEF